ncbi:30S ribosomal protein S13 [Candidatus Pacearchaeota archaeon CG10_big_fil_rev_8_21_14_0_10_35_13]|nr:MAG: 30S ribosomal protein S13 [Candidatus Pacearchaeota archaeon CG10_big_fil_rev_8_21_14_0_10_35_13]
MAEKEQKIIPKPGMKQPKEEFDLLVRILDKDIKGQRRVVVGLRRIKGVSWAISNATCTILKIPTNKKIAELTEKEIKEIEDFLKNPKVPDFLINRRKDHDSGENKHLVSTNLDFKKDFDIKLLKKIRSYRGLRHALGLPTRGQRTKSHFRANKKSRVVVGVKSKKGGK